MKRLILLLALLASAQSLADGPWKTDYYCQSVSLKGRVDTLEIQTNSFHQHRVRAVADFGSEKRASDWTRAYVSHTSAGERLSNDNEGLRIELNTVFDFDGEEYRQILRATEVSFKDSGTGVVQHLRPMSCGPYQPM